MTLGLQCLNLLIKIQLVISGFTASNARQMVQLNAIRSALSLKAIINNLAQTYLKLLVQFSSQRLFKVFYPSPSPLNGPYIKFMFKYSKMDLAKPTSPPLASTCFLYTHEGEPFDDLTLYRSIVGCLQYLSFTCPNFTFFVNHVCQFMHQPLLPPWQAAKCIFHYLNNTISHDLFLSCSSPMHLCAYSNSNWANDHDDGCSIVHIAFFLAIILCHGSCISNKLLPKVVLKLNTRHQ